MNLTQLKAKLPPYGLHLIAAWLFFMVTLISAQLVDPDLWGRLSIAALWFQNGQFPYHDVFSFTAPNAPWIDHEWLTGVVFYGLLIGWGEPAFLIFRYLMILLTFWLVFDLHHRCYKSSPLTAFYGLLLLSPIYVLGYMSVMRSHVFTFLGMLLFIWVLERIRTKQLPVKTLGWLIPLGILWGNMHGGFIVGVALCGAYGLAASMEQRNFKAGLPHFVTGAAIFVLLGLFNPYGPKYLSFLMHAWALARTGVGEWRPIPLEKPYFLGAQALIAGGLILLVLNWGKRVKTEFGLLAPTLVLLGIMALCMRAIRFQTLLALVSLAYAPLLLSGLKPVVSRWLQPLDSALSRLIPTLILVCAIGMLGFGAWQKLPILHASIADELTTLGPNDFQYPAGAITFLERSPYRGNLAIPFSLGEFAYWRLYPRFKVALDGRYEEVYPQSVFDTFHQYYHWIPAQGIKSFQTFLATTPTDFIIIQNNTMPMFWTQHHPAWTLIYQDNAFSVLAKQKTLKQFPAFQQNLSMITTEKLTIRHYANPKTVKRFRHHSLPGE